MQNYLIYALLIYIALQGLCRFQILKVYRLFSKKGVDLNPKELLLNTAYRESLYSDFGDSSRQLDIYYWSFTASIGLTVAMIIFIIFTLVAW